MVAWIAAVAMVAAVGSLAVSLLVLRNTDEAVVAAELRANEAEAKLAQLASAVSELEGSTGSLEGELSGLTTDLGALSGDLDSLNSDLDSLSGDLTSIAGDQFNPREVASGAIDSVVTVRCDGSLGSGFSYEIRTPEGYGSAILTNHHVVADCVDLDGPAPAVIGQEVSDGKMWAWDAGADIALMFIRESVPPLRQAAPASLGDPVVTIGSPYGFSGTVSQGIVSKVFSHGLTTDAAIDHGNSGGPLLDRNGDVLGITTLNVLGADALNYAVGIWEACGTILECPEQ